MQIIADFAAEHNKATRVQRRAGMCEKKKSALTSAAAPQALSPNSLPHPRAGAENYPGFPEASHIPVIVAMILERKKLILKSQEGLKLEGQGGSGTRRQTNPPP